MSSRPRLEVKGLSASWGQTEVLSGIDLTVSDGEFVVLMGPNGSGKTTLLRAIAGFETPTRGEVRLDGRLVSGLPAHRRGIGILFQEPALFPRRTVWENIAYGLEIARRPPREVEARVSAVSELLHLRALEDRDPQALSGGERQRVALARTLAPGPSLVLFDEPFASVDPELRGGLRAEFRVALRRYGTAAIHVTHDREEGLFLGDRVVLLHAGRIVQSGPPREVYGAPANAAAARFLGYNLVEVEGRSVAVDPRDVEVLPSGNGISAEVEISGSTGAGESAILRLEGGARIEARTDPRRPALTEGQRVGLRWLRTVVLPGAPSARPDRA